MGWDLSRVSQRLIQTKGMKPETVKKMEFDYRRYLFILAKNRNVEFPLSEPIDEFGHQHMLDTHDFQAMRDQIFGGAMIHHSPTVNEEERTELLPEYHDRTLCTFLNTFGEEPNPVMWPFDRCVCKWSAADK